MKRKIRYVICGVAAAALLAAFFIWEKAAAPHGSLSVRVQAPDVRGIPATDITVTTGRRQTKTTAVSETAETAAFSTELTVTTAIIRDLNAADAQSLMRVPGIGETLANEIVAYRAVLGGFTRRSQLMEISGIGETLTAHIMEEFEISGELPETTASAAETTAPPETVTAAPTETTETAASTETTQAAPPEPQDLNTIGREALLEIPGVTEQIADSILAVRDTIGGYNTVYETALIQGISEQFVTEKLCPYLYVENDTYRNAKIK